MLFSTRWKSLTRPSVFAVLVVAFMVWGPGAMAGGGSVSPSAILQKADATLGSELVNFPERPGGPGEPEEDKTLSPFFYVAGGDPDTDRLPLKETSADVQIAGVIAKVKVRQVFENSGAKPIEAVYVFPASTRAAVHGMRMKIGSRTIEAKIERRQAARQQYEQAKEAGKRASLLEQERPNVFTMSVANIMPKDRIEVELDYSELLVPEEAVYEFVYPTVVGPRYGGGADKAKDKWIENPYLKEGEKEPCKFDIRAHVESGIPIKDLSSPSHEVTVDYPTKTSADVRLKGPGGGNKDFVLRYRLAGDQIETGLLLWQGQGESFFVLMMEPPQRPASAQIPPREYIFLLDVSGSMHGFPLDTTKVLMEDLLSKLRPTDFFNLALFAGASYVMNKEGSVPATPGNIQVASDLIARQTGGGGTELMGGLQAAYSIPKRKEGVSRSVVVVTDGYVGVEAQAFKFIRDHLNETNLFAFGIGSSVNRGLIEGMARAGMGEPFVVLKPEKAKAEAEKLRAYIQSPVLSDIDIRFKGFDAYEVAPTKVPDLMAKRPIVLFGKWRGDPTGKIEVTGYTGGGKFEQAIEVGPKAVKSENAPVRWLWARKWVAILDDEMALGAAKEVEEGITDLGLTYSLLTAFTSFVAIDSEVVNKSGQAETVKQPLPLPEGVSNLAVGEQGTATAKYYVPPAPLPAAPPRPGMAMPYGPPMRTKMAPSGGAGSVSKQLSRDEERAISAPKFQLMIVDLEAANLGDAGALVKEIEARLERSEECVAGKESIVKLRLTVDGSGKVTDIEILDASDKKLAACVQKQLLGIVSESRAGGAGIGSLVLTLKAIQT